MSKRALMAVFVLSVSLVACGGGGGSSGSSPSNVPTPTPSGATPTSSPTTSTATPTATPAAALPSQAIYVSNGNNGSANDNVLVFPVASSGNATPTSSIGGSNTNLALSEGIALDASGRIYVANAYPANVDIFAAGSNGNVAPVATITNAGSAFETLGVAVDKAGNIYVTNQGGGTHGNVTVYAAGASGVATPTETIVGANTLLNGPQGIAIGANGNIYVTNGSASGFSGSTVLVFAPGANGNVAPIATITSAGYTATSATIGIALDASQNIYVTSSGAGGSTASVLEFKAGSNGNVTPIITIAGSNTQMYLNAGLALDTSGNIYVANSGGGELLEYAAGANGNVAPTATIFGGSTGLLQPSGIAVH